MEHKNRDLYNAGLVILILISLLTIMPFLFAGPPVSLYSIQNGDSNHTISIEIVSLNKIPIHKDEYHLAPMENVVTDKSMLSLLYIPLIGDKCTIKTTLDSNSPEIREVSLGIWEMPYISITNSTIYIDYMVV
ncbi:MAG TPA: hypothetical protein PKC27_10685 [Methanomethylovorans sp.]|nr:hypothetical protein [Methanomethylovorans sp.]